ncbi:DUF4442 domain-containing protein [Sandarakinorhabdus oryzae]|uniref:DUF4442 domain-containing protein n=1 Tax=Sandarakinorhabdus oryzae TaxID=2675220 RepID=UPI0012E12F95|nr:DUF4442 domain-containing protein [Sandarakinorhabdus oryzae]
MLDLIRDQLNRSVPFASHTGVAILSIGTGTAEAALEQSPTSINHIGSQHAGALFTLGEAASGAAMVGLFAARLGQVRPVTADAGIRYARIARGRITATARCDTPADALLERLDADGKVSFAVDVSMSDDSGRDVAAMQVTWHVSQPAHAA